MTIKLYEAIVSSWDTASLDSTFTGGLWYQRAKRGASWPYVVFLSISNVPDGWTSDRKIIRHDVQFDIFYKDDGSTDPLSQLGTLTSTFLTTFDEKNPTLASADGDVFDVRLIDEDYSEEEDGIWRARLDMEFMRNKPRNP